MCYRSYQNSNRNVKFLLARRRYGGGRMVDGRVVVSMLLLCSVSAEVFVYHSCTDGADS